MKMIKKIVCVLLCLTMIFSLAACSKEKTNTVGKELEITDEQFAKTMKLYEQLYRDEFGKEKFDDILKKNDEFMKEMEESVFRRMALELVIIEEANSAGIEATDKEIDDEFKKVKESYKTEEEYQKYLTDREYTEETLKSEIKKSLLMNKFLAQKSAEIINSKSDEKAMKELYSKNPATYNQIQASHILVEDEATAKEIKTKLDAGDDFAKLAKEKSTCPSKENGGDLGLFSAGDVVPEFAAAAFALEKGQISEPVKTDFGYHIIKVTEIKDTFEKIDKSRLDYEVKNAEYEKLLENYFKNANLKLSDELDKIRDRCMKKLNA